MKKKYNDKASQIQIHLHMKSKLEIYIKIFGVRRINLIIVNIQKTPHISINKKKWLESSKMKYQEFQFIGLRTKMYSYLKDTDEYGKTAKGIKKNVIKKILNMTIIKTFYSTINKYTMQ